jgi:hypothetical protein
MAQLCVLNLFISFSTFTGEAVLSKSVVDDEVSCVVLVGSSDRRECMLGLAAKTVALALL